MAAARAVGENGRVMTTALNLPPGPSQPGIWQALRYVWRFPAYTAELHASYGPSYTLRLPGLPPSVVTSDRVLIKQMLTGNPLRSRHANDILGAILGEGSLMLLEPAAHLARRKLLLPPFHGERMKTYRTLVRELVAAELDDWAAGSVVRVHDRARRLTLAVIQSAVLGAPDDELARKLSKILDTMASPVANLGLFAPALQRSASASIRRLRPRLDSLIGECVHAARADPALAERDDVLALLLRTADEEGHSLDDAELVDELKTLLIAGHESTATAIAWAADILAHDPQAAAHLRAADDPQVARAAKEVLRLRTVAPISVARTLLEPIEAEGRSLPRGSVVVVDALTLHRDPELFPQPAQFRPERFSDRGPAPYAYLPFGGGAHRCLGAALATLELEQFLAAVTERYRLEPTGRPEKAVRRGPTLVPARGAAVRVQPIA
jgi:cytochrome P450